MGLCTRLEPTWDSTDKWQDVGAAVTSRRSSSVTQVAVRYRRVLAVSDGGSFIWPPGLVPVALVVEFGGDPIQIDGDAYGRVVAPGGAKARQSRVPVEFPAASVGRRGGSRYLRRCCPVCGPAFACPGLTSVNGAWLLGILELGGAVAADSLRLVSGCGQSSPQSGTQMIRCRDCRETPERLSQISSKS